MLVIFMIHTFLLTLHFLLMFLSTLISTEFQEKAKWVFDFQSSIKTFVSKMQILREAKTNNYSHFCHFREFNATIDVDFHEELDLEEVKKDFLDYLENLTRNNARFKDLIAESLDLHNSHLKLIPSTVVLLHLRWLN